MLSLSLSSSVYLPRRKVVLSAMTPLLGYLLKLISNTQPEEQSHLHQYLPGALGSLGCLVLHGHLYRPFRPVLLEYLVGLGFLLRLYPQKYEKYKFLEDCQKRLLNDKLKCVLYQYQLQFLESQINLQLYNHFLYYWYYSKNHCGLLFHKYSIVLR